MSALCSIFFLSSASIVYVVQAHVAEEMSLDEASPTLRTLLGRESKDWKIALSNKSLFDYFLAEQPWLRGKISEPTRLKREDVGSPRHPGWCPWLQQEERTATKSTASLSVDLFNVAPKADLFNLLSWWSKDKAEAIKDEAQHMCADSIRVWNVYVERKGKEYPNAANAVRIEEPEAKLLCGVFDLRQSLNYCSSKGLLVRIVDGVLFDESSDSRREFEDMPKDDYTIFQSASVINQEHPVTVGGLGAGVMFEKENGKRKEREIVVLAGGTDLGLPTGYGSRKRAGLDAKSMKVLLNEKKKKGEAAYKSLLDKKRQNQLQKPHVTLREFICVNESWLKQQKWTQPRRMPDNFLSVVIGNPSKPQKNSNCRSFDLISAVGAKRALSKNGSEALQFALGISTRRFAKAGVNPTRLDYNEAMVDINAQNVHAIWVMESRLATKSALETAEDKATQLFGNYMAKFNMQPLFVRIFAQAGAVFQSLPSAAAVTYTAEIVGSRHSKMLLGLIKYQIKITKTLTLQGSNGKSTKSKSIVVERTFEEFEALYKKIEKESFSDIIGVSPPMPVESEFPHFPNRWLSLTHEINMDRQERLERFLASVLQKDPDCTRHLSKFLDIQKLEEKKEFEEENDAESENIEELEEEKKFEETHAESENIEELEEEKKFEETHAESENIEELEDKNEAKEENAAGEKPHAQIVRQLYRF